VGSVIHWHVGSRQVIGVLMRRDIDYTPRDSTGYPIVFLDS
jgi:hypothetical protein